MRRFFGYPVVLLLLGSLWFTSICHAQTTVHTLVFGGLTRSYRLHLPTNYTGATPVPLVFNLHGYTSNAQQQELYSEMNAVADTAGFILCYPDGVNNAWNSGFTLPYYSGVDDVGFISTLIDVISGQYNIDPARVYSCGMSNGGYMSYRLACDLENRIAAIASVTGSMTLIQQLNCSCNRPMPVLQIHGTADATVPYIGGSGSMGIDDVIGYWKSHNQCAAPATLDTLANISLTDFSTVTTQWYPSCDSGVEVGLFKVEGGSHTWPGATYLIPGLVTNQDFEASIEIWKFFYRFRHPNATLTSVNGAPVEHTPIVSPNPVVLGRGNDQLKVSGLGPEARLQLMDLHGQAVATWTAAGEVSEMDMGKFPSGIYLLQIIGSDRQTCHKVVVQR
ncbi:MAG: PHB depolymerase family esterase [Bacteroidia bacterium]